METTQHHTQAMPAAQLDALGISAAKLAETSGIDLGEAVVRTLQNKKLAAQQVRRVVEACNVAAVNRKFASMAGAAHRIVGIAGGPADPTYVLAALQGKTAALHVGGLEHAQEVGMHVSFAQLDADVPHMRTKLAAAHSELVEEREVAACRAEEALESLKVAAHSAARQGAQLAELYMAWAQVHPTMAKVASASLRQELVWGQPSNRHITPAHPVVTKFAAFAEAAQALHQANNSVLTVESELIRVADWLQQ